MKPSRMMITGELGWAWVAIVFAYVGAGLPPFQMAYLHLALDKADVDWLWGFAVGAPGLALLVFALREYLAFRYPSVDIQRRWTLVEIDRSARLRGRMNLALAFSWAYIIYANLQTSSRPSVVLPVAAGGIIFSLWFWVENRRVQRDIRKDTASFPSAALR